uniref:Actinin, alpha 2b n=1 Tax=Eptatretus burgeri TaxID=7764 RepID=A0A8C4QCZ8_EPTBU
MASKWAVFIQQTFTAWCNSHLRKAGTSISSIEDDFRDGLKLMLLLEVISGERLPRPERGKMRVHRIANVNKALNYIISKDVRLVSIGAEEIVDGNVKMTLGMIWTIILRFAIQDISVEEMSAKEGLLLWCQRKTAPYDNVNVNNFHTSWKDGLAFCALIHRHRPDLIDYSELRKDDPLTNLNTAFEVAEKNLDIPKMLDADDIVNTPRPDEKTIMTYISCFYHAFSGAQKAETAANRICKVLEANQENEKLMEEYERIASDLLAWIDQQIPWLSKRETQPSLAPAQTLLSRHSDYSKEERPPHAKERNRLNTTFNSLQTRLRLHNRPNFMPAEGHLVADIAHAWERLEGAECGYEEWLLSEMQRLQRLDHLVAKFKIKADGHEAWSAGIDQQLENEILGGGENLATDESDGPLKIGNNLATVQVLIRRQEALESDLAAHQEGVEQIAAIAQELNELEYEDVVSVNTRCEAICNHWDDLGKKTQARHNVLKQQEAWLAAVDNLQKGIVARATPFLVWLHGAADDLQDPFLLYSVAEVQVRVLLNHITLALSLTLKLWRLVNVIWSENLSNFFCFSHNLSFSPFSFPQALLKAHIDFKATLPAAQTERDGLLAMWTELDKLQQAPPPSFVRPSQRLPSENPYTDILPLDITSMWDQVQLLVVQREQALLKEQVCQEQRQALKNQYRTVAASVAPWIQRHAEEAGRLVSGSISGSLEERNVQLHRLKEELSRQEGNLSRLEELHTALHHAGVYDTAHTPYPMERVRVGWEALGTALAHAESQLETEAAGGARNLTPEQLRELQAAFNHFDKKKKGILDAEDFRACLISMGHVLGEAEFARLLAGADPVGTGVVSFAAFLDVMAREAGATGSTEQTVEAFRILAGDKPYILPEELRQELPPEQAEYCIASMSPSTDPVAPPGALDYSSFASALYGQSDL